MHCNRHNYYLLFEGATLKFAPGLGQWPVDVWTRKPSVENFIWQPGQKTAQVLMRCHASGETPIDELKACIPHSIIEFLNSHSMNGCRFKAAWYQNKAGGGISWSAAGWSQAADVLSVTIDLWRGQADILADT